MTRPARPLRIMMLTDALEPGGLERVVVTLSTALDDRGHEVTVVAEPGGALWDDLPSSVRRSSAPPRRTVVQRLRYLVWLARQIRSGRFDLVHAHQRAVALQARLVRTRTAVRVVEHVHSTFAVGVGVGRWLSFRGDRLIACGPTIQDMLVRDFRRRPGRISTVLNAVPDLSAGCPPLLPAVAEGTLPSVLVLARVTDVKDPLRFIDVFAAANAEGRRCTAVWAGDGDLLQQCRDVVAQRGLVGIDFVGGRSDVAAAIAKADLVMLTSKQEGLPLSLLEASSMGRPLVAPRIGSCAAVVDDGRNGRLFERDSSPTEVAQVLWEVLDRSVLGRMGRASREKYLAEFAIDGYVEKVEEVYASADRR